MLFYNQNEYLLLLECVSYFLSLYLPLRSAAGQGEFCIADRGTDTKIFKGVRCAGSVSESEWAAAPEMHLPFLSEKQRLNVRRIDGDYLSQRRVSLYIRHDYIRQRMLNSIIEVVMRFIPKNMIDGHIVKYGIKL